MTRITDNMVLQGFVEGLKLAIAASAIPDIPVKYPAIDFELPNDQKYLELVFFPNDGANDFWGDEQNKKGIFRLILHWPKDGQGFYPPASKLATITAGLTKETPLSNVKISGTPQTGGVLEQDKENLFPVSIRYTSFSQ